MPLRSCNFIISESYKNIGPKTGEIIGRWRKLHSEEHHDFYSSSDIVTMIKSRRMRLARHVARRERREV